MLKYYNDYNTETWLSEQKVWNLLLSKWTSKQFKACYYIQYQQVCPSKQISEQFEAFYYVQYKQVYLLD